MTTRVVQGAAVLLAGGIAALAVSVRGCATGSELPARTIAAGSAIVTVHPAFDAKGVIATSGGWAYCQQVRSLTRRFRYTLVCGGYPKDGYTQRGLRNLRHLDWGSPMYLDNLARVIREGHREREARSCCSASRTRASESQRSGSINPSSDLTA